MQREHGDQMDDIIDVQLGQAISTEEWLAAAGRLKSAAPLLAAHLGSAADLCRSDFRMAVAAMEFVGRFASENCRFIVIP